MNDFVVVNGKKYYATGGVTGHINPKKLSKEDRARLAKGLADIGYQNTDLPSVQDDFINNAISLAADGEDVSSIDDVINIAGAYKRIPTLGQQESWYYDKDMNRVHTTTPDSMSDYKKNVKIHPQSGEIVGMEGKSPERQMYEWIAQYGNRDEQKQWFKDAMRYAVQNAKEGENGNLITPFADNNSLFLYTDKRTGHTFPIHKINGKFYGDDEVENGVLEYDEYGMPHMEGYESWKYNTPRMNEYMETRRIQDKSEPAWQPVIMRGYNMQGQPILNKVDNKMYDRKTNEQLHQLPQEEVKAYGGRTSRRLYAAGGSMGMIPMGEQEDYNMVGAGGSHEQNPMGGVPYGMNADGSQNMVEQGETSVGNQVYSDRSSLSPELCQQLGLPEGTSPSQAMQQIEALYEQGQISDEEYQEIQNIIFQDQEMQKQNSGASYQQGGVGGPGVPQNEGIQPDMVGAGGQQFAYGGFRGFRF